MQNKNTTQNVTDTDLLKLFQDNPQRAWSLFCEKYSDFIYTILRRAGFDYDEAKERFVNVFEKLCEADFRRFKTIKYAGNEGDLTPWLRQVVKNLCVNWAWSEDGRKRLFGFVAEMPPRQQRVFQLYFWQGQTPFEIYETLRLEHDKTVESGDVFDSLETIFERLSEKKLWRLMSNLNRMRKTLSLDYEDEDGGFVIEPIDETATNAEENLQKKEVFAQLKAAREKVFALVLTRAQFRFIELPVTKANLKNKVKIFRNLLFEKWREKQISDEENSSNSDWCAVSESLRNSLIEPLKLENINRLAIIPEGFLHDLPFAALAKTDGENVKFLIEDFTIFYLPSATFLQSDFSHRERGERREFFSFGINQTEDLPELKFAEEETVAVAEIFGGKSNVKTDATETAVKDSIPKASYLHFATHTIVEPNMPLLSRLVFAKSEKDDGNLTTREIFVLGLDAELVTIAACESDFVFSDEENTTNRVGLTEAFLHAGAESVLSSLLPVSDAATTDFMKDFYANLKSKDKAESLAITQRKMLHGKFKHPRFWSPFVLVGADH